ncbi:MAG: hypothetical protein WB586_13540 [Chthoniobacterales bacterium]
MTKGKVFTDLSYPIFGPGFFDRLYRQFRRPATYSDRHCFVINDTTRVAPKELIHRNTESSQYYSLEALEPFVQDFVKKDVAYDSGYNPTLWGSLLRGRSTACCSSNPAFS